METTTAHPLAQDLGRVGIWSSALRSEDPARRTEIADAAAELDELGYGTLWLGGSPGVAQAVPVLAATSRLTVATGILSIWQHEPADVARAFNETNAAHGGRFVLGLGVSHSALTDRYRRPYSAMVDYLTALDEAPDPVPADRRVLAALGPRMLKLARDRAAGAHPYLVTPEHTGVARDVLSDTVVLAPELKVVLDTDLDRARATARAYLSFYLGLPNYTNNLRRLGFDDQDFTGGGSDKLLTAVFALGDADAVRRRADAYLAAGADHLALQVVTGDPLNDIPLPAYRALADAFELGGQGG
ncbi:LLM class F420-dependent oxidoreductase [Streptomyces litchfieldiae]|uniref:LLM class F420-dependent oxidoreductase n=1 Tax=Streptomyces litchfieldiae TaxID=3075543 RepID=A0ABU2MKI0_9ACTN|nr:LLM class F420-dependent oxidoreductase [Streptomyces sp. DSM 44938]MDT0342025.1 LLM class F420-dependent oxidoreductase [Streptomyces sp. DSM 44938]